MKRTISVMDYSVTNTHDMIVESALEELQWAQEFFDQATAEAERAEINLKNFDEVALQLKSSGSETLEDVVSSTIAGLRRTVAFSRENVEFARQELEREQKIFANAEAAAEAQKKNKHCTAISVIQANTDLSVQYVLESVATLRKAMKGLLDTDEHKIISILSTYTAKQDRLGLTNTFNQDHYGSLEDNLRNEFGGNFGSLIVGLITSPTEYLARQLNKAIKRAGIDANLVSEVLITRSNEELEEIADTYEKIYYRSLVEHLNCETSGDFKKLLIWIVIGVRNSRGKPSPERAQQLAEELFEAGEAKRGTCIKIFVQVFAHESYDQLKLLFEKYKAVSGRTIEQALKSELSGDLLNITLAIVECVQSPTAFFAKQLNRAMKRTETDNQTLIRIIVSRRELDLENIKSEYKSLYDKTLASDVKNEVSNDYKYKKAMLVLIGGP